MARFGVVDGTSGGGGGGDVVDVCIAAGAGVSAAVVVGVGVVVDPGGAAGVGISGSVGVGAWIDVWVGGGGAAIAIGESVGAGVRGSVTSGGGSMVWLEVLGFGSCFEVVTVFLLSRDDAQLLDSERLSGLKKLKQRALMAGFEPATFGRRQSCVGKLKVGDGLEGGPHAVEPGFEPSRQRAQR